MICIPNLPNLPKCLASCVVCLLGAACIGGIITVAVLQYMGKLDSSSPTTADRPIMDGI